MGGWYWSQKVRQNIFNGCAQLFLYCFVCEREKPGF